MSSEALYIASRLATVEREATTTVSDVAVNAGRGQATAGVMTKVMTVDRASELAHGITLTKLSFKQTKLWPNDDCEE